MSWLSSGIGWIGDHLGGGGSHTPPMPGAITPPVTSPINTGPQTLPLGAGGAGNSPFTSAQQQQLQSAFSAAGIWDTIQNLGGDVWGAIAGLLPKNADGSVDWGGALKDVGSWVKNNKSTILDGLSTYNSYQRSQKSDRYGQQALDLATKEYAAKQPLRDAGQAGMLNPQSGAPDISALRAQGQTGLQLAAPIPQKAPTLNLANAQTLATSGGANPFTKTLPPAPTGLPLATPTAPAAPTAPQVPGMRKILPLGRATY